MLLNKETGTYSLKLFFLRQLSFTTHPRSLQDYFLNALTVNTVLRDLLDGNAQSITFLSRSLNTNPACLLTRQSRVLMRVREG